MPSVTSCVKGLFEGIFKSNFVTDLYLSFVLDEFGENDVAMDFARYDAALIALPYYTIVKFTNSWVSFWDVGNKRYYVLVLKVFTV